MTDQKSPRMEDEKKGSIGSEAPARAAAPRSKVGKLMGTQRREQLIRYAQALSREASAAVQHPLAHRRDYHNSDGIELLASIPESDREVLLRYYNGDASRCKYLVRDHLDTVYLKEHQASIQDKLDRIVKALRTVEKSIMLSTDAYSVERLMDGFPDALDVIVADRGPTG